MTIVYAVYLKVYEKEARPLLVDSIYTTLELANKKAAKLGGCYRIKPWIVEEEA